MMIILAGVVSLILLATILWPFFVGEGGSLAPAATENSPEKLAETCQAIVSQYVADELAFHRQDLTPRAWSKRREYLTHRYIDAARRLDFLRNTSIGEQ